MANLKTDSIGKLIWCFTIPSLVGTLANTLYNIVDRIFIGQGVGALALSGLGLTFPIMNILSAFGMLVGQGAAAIASIKMGEDDKALKRILPNTLLMIVICYAIVSCVMLCWLKPILTTFGGSEATIPYADEYLRIVIPGHIFISLGWGLSNVIRAVGKPRLAMETLVFGALLNIVLDPLFIFWLDMGIQGAAIATVLSMFASAAWAMTFFTKKEHEISLRTSEYKIDTEIIAKILSIGMSPFLLQLCNSLVNIFMNTSLKRYGGDLAIGAFGIISSYSTLVTMTVVGLAHGLQPIIGYNYGAKKTDRVNETLRKGIIIGSIISIVGWLGAELAPRAIALCFNNQNEILIGMAANGLRIYCLMLGMVGFHVIVTNYYQSIGHARISIALTLARQVIFLIPCIILLPMTGVFGLSELNLLWFSQPVTTLLSCIMAGIVLKLTIENY